MNSEEIKSLLTKLENIERSNERKDFREERNEYRNRFQLFFGVSKYPDRIIEYSKSELQEARDQGNDYLEELNRAFNKEHDYIDKRVGDQPGYGLMIKNLSDSHQKKIKAVRVIIQRIDEKINKLSPKTIIGDNGKSPANHKGDLTDQCIEDLKELAEEYPDKPIFEFFKIAFNQKESCRKALKKVDGKPKKISISQSTLSNRVKKHYPKIYYRNRKARKK